MNQRREPIEPSADIRGFAAALRQMYVALVYEGFTEREALAIIGHVLSASTGRDDDS